MPGIADLAVCSGLNLEIFEEQKIQGKSEIPIQSFGVFVTVKRSEKQRLKKWPEDIHGCIGYWEEHYKKLNKDILLEKVLSLAKQSTWEDSRKEHYDQISLDAYANYDVSFMMKPVIKIDPETGRMVNGDLFTNETYGIIAVDDKGNKATYLPDVFPDKKWEEIKSDIISKARITGEYSFFAYRVKKFGEQIINVLKQYFNYIIKDFLSFVYQKYGYNREVGIPYEYIGTIVQYDEKQYVRNIATIHDILMFMDLLPSKLINKCIKDLEYYRKIIETNFDSIRQASSFYILAQKLLEKRVFRTGGGKARSIILRKNNKRQKNNTLRKNNTRIIKIPYKRGRKRYTRNRRRKGGGSSRPLLDIICNNLYDNLDKLETRFELCEVLIALNECCLRKEQIRIEYKKIIKRLSIKNTLSLDDIFELNWQSKFLYSLYTHETFTRTELNDYINLLIVKVKDYLDKFTLEDLETNYLAVTIELLSCLIVFNTQFHDTIVHLYYLLNRRYKDGLFYFKNKTARLDITGHILNAMRNIMKS